MGLSTAIRTSGRSRSSAVLAGYYLGLSVLVLVFTGPAHADAVISGPSCVIDGNTLQVGSKLRDGKCWGGIDVRLHGSKAPTSDETCSASDGNKWACGEAAKNALRTMVRQHAISCFHIDGEFEDNIPVVTCLSGRRDLAMEMVRQGMAKALHDQSNRYELEETDAKRKKRGLWQ